MANSIAFKRFVSQAGLRGEKAFFQLHRGSRTLEKAFHRGTLRERSPKAQGRSLAAKDAKKAAKYAKRRPLFPSGPGSCEFRRLSRGFHAIVATLLQVKDLFVKL